MDNLIETKNLGKKYGNKIILSNINIIFEKGKIIKIIGENGSGKTTFFKLLLNLTHRTSGEIIIKDGICLSGIIETPGFFDNMTGFENIKALSPKINVDKQELLSLAKDFNLDLYLDTKVKKYSLGMKQKLALIYVFISNSDVILLDEPTNAIDVDALKMLKKYLIKLKKEGKLILIASHNDNFFDNFIDVTYEIKNGTINNITNDNIYLKAHLFELENIVSAIEIIRKNKMEYIAKENKILIFDKNNYGSKNILRLFFECGIKKYIYYKDTEIAINDL